LELLAGNAKTKHTCHVWSGLKKIKLHVVGAGSPELKPVEKERSLFCEAGTTIGLTSFGITSLQAGEDVKKMSFVKFRKKASNKKWEPFKL